MMSKKTRLISKNKNGVTKGELKLLGLIMSLIRSDQEWLGRILLKILRFKWHGRPIQIGQAAKEMTLLPTGPFETTRKGQSGDLLLWVPRRIDSYLIDDLTGGYGYSHATIDTGEIDLPTGKAVMAEITIGQTVSRKFQDEYDQRAFVRVPILKTGVKVEQFVACVKSKMGEGYDDWGAITLGEIKDPAKEICSGLVADCLPQKERKRIAWAKRLGRLRSASVSVHSKPFALKTKEFISPNGFAEYYGIPKGRKITRPDTTIQPRPVKISVVAVAVATAHWRGWRIAAGVFAIVLLVFMLKRTR